MPKKGTRKNLAKTHSERVVKQFSDSSTLTLYFIHIPEGGSRNEGFSVSCVHYILTGYNHSK